MLEVMLTSEPDAGRDYGKLVDVKLDMTLHVDELRVILNVLEEGGLIDGDEAAELRLEFCAGKGR